MRFATIAMAVGLVGAFLASNLQAPLTASTDDLAFTTVVDGTITTGSIAAVASAEAPGAMRLIDLKTGATCKVAKPDPDARDFHPVPFGPDCIRSPGLSRVSLWRSTDEGALIMADSGGGTILEFAPGDGVLYESIYPANQLITIVPAKS
ncbi:hypothetical protein Sa4125_36060 [Aureimonas sp. SA4125]|uniref:hypothetical protein n=1 Tax=Aureimonas sp. SA4125 TaxID=2826993 RepID=UPI001CC3B61B|nr:hypothetical protein [Aureimonas sp. SA4125]BDA86064.1 hypothetical protein Sa4125_36060 [Aureimonas sp. SA4125]